ncbi:MAG: SCP2 sterol-binding domain-containing protein [Sumerlaeia bacterium]
MNDLQRCDYYLRHWLPPRLGPDDARLLLSIGVPVAMELHDGERTEEVVLLQTEAGLTFPRDREPVCRYRLSAQTFLRIVANEMSPQRALFTGKLRLSGDQFLAVRLGSLLDSIFRRLPWDGHVKSGRGAGRETSPRAHPLSGHQRRVLALHLDPREGSPFWRWRAAERGLSADDFRTIEDLRAAFGPMDRAEMLRHTWRDFVPVSILETEGPFLLGETGGTTGPPVTLGWTAADFKSAFLDPLCQELGELGITGLRQWLFAGPTGPHIIGKAADAIARRTSGCDALKVDFDPRWHRRLLPGTTASTRHLEHLIEQTLGHFNRHPVDALFITPSILKVLLARLSASRFEQLRLVHLGGQSLTLAEWEVLRERLPADCQLINGFGNSLFGCLIEDRRDPLTYGSFSDRWVVELREPGPGGFARAPEGARGRLVFHRFDESALLLNCDERDEAIRRGDRFHAPAPAAETRSLVAGGIY